MLLDVNRCKEEVRRAKSGSLQKKNLPKIELEAIAGPENGDFFELKKSLLQY